MEQIKKWGSKIVQIPARIMIIPLFLGASVYTFIPQILEIGSFTTAVFSNEAATTLMGLQLLCLGSRIEIRKFGQVFRYGGAILFGKILSGFVLAVVCMNLFGKDGFWGISVLAMICAVSNTNGSMYLSFMAAKGDKLGGAASPIITINNGPFVTLVLLGMTGLSSFDYMQLIAALFPVVFGLVLGNISEKCKEFLAPGCSLLIPFIGFSLGAGINLKNLFFGGMSGILLGVIAVVVSVIITGLSDKYIGGNTGYGGIVASCVGANAIAVPAFIGQMDASFAPYVEAATAQVAAAAIVSIFLVSAISSWWSHNY
ncbi:MAG: 2-keto-3-deoxygluconate permease [Eubacteriales bacterium]